MYFFNLDRGGDFVEDKNIPNYFAVIPANVRYDNDISPNAKLLYGEITALCNKMGFCWATNEYFSKLYNLSDRTIRSLLKQLSDKNYIKIFIKDYQMRYIYIDFTRAEENFLPPGKKLPTSPEKNFLHNNKSEYSNNQKEINKEKFDINNFNWFE